MMAKDENLKQVHNLAAVPEGADKVTTPCFSNMYIVQVVCTRHRLLPDVLVACVEASMTSQMCRQDNRDFVNILSNVIEGLLATCLWHRVQYLHNCNRRSGIAAACIAGLKNY